MNEQNNITPEDFAYSQDVIKKLSEYFEAKVVGQNQLKFSLIASIIADGHILIESVPGLAKTTAAKAISDAVDGQFARIQCTPDLLPGDIIGTQIYNQATCKFETMLGPVFANFVLLDEVNRSSAKTQSAMLEAMQEKQVTIGGTTYRMPEDIFIVIATQNPIEQEGTYPLSEAQTDRFLIKEVISYPTAAEEVEILRRIETGAISEVTPAVLTIKDVDKVQDIVDQVYVDESVKWYISSIVVASRRANQIPGFELGKYVRIGVSPRASIAFLKMAKAAALMQGRTYATPDDVKFVRHQVLRHRIGLNYSAVADSITVETVIDGIVNSVKTP
ncbi:MoxR family ATPase [Butyrivibrio sp. X503]|uniref:AAA family ATPase n=1 Tax=Butyrivibrio sp. X503 TaxID=2364878 RepID=UPI000EA9FA2E|nr:MoxR family ATPase [Butyrivibrio sp. X503]RKM58122.1 MoxR family ATPase [Butyrivibrio sp. X503]